MGSLPSNRETNPKEQVNALFVHGGDKCGVKEDGVLGKALGQSKKMETNVVEPKQVLREYKPHIPYPHSLYQREQVNDVSYRSDKKEKEVTVQPQLVKEFKPQTPNPVAKLEPAPTNLDEASSTTWKRELPEKLKDPGSFFLSW